MLWRVFGLAVDDEDDDDQNADTHEIVEEDSLARETTADDNPINLFSSATGKFYKMRILEVLQNTNLEI